MEKTDLVKTCKPYYSAKVKPEYRSTEPGEFLSITGRGDPGEADYAERIRTLYATAFEIRKISRVDGLDFVVPSLEVLWDFPCTGLKAISLAEVSLRVPPKDWGYCLMLRMPRFVTKTQVARATRQVALSEGLMLAGEIELHARLEERVVQVLHRGAPAGKHLSVARIEAFMREKCLLQDGLHHEIYLTDPGDTDSARMRTIIRIPVKRKATGPTRLR